MSVIRTSNLSKLLFEFEDNRFEQIKDIKIDNWLLWGIIKRPLFYELFGKQNKIGVPNKSKNKLIKHFSILELLWKLPSLRFTKNKFSYLFFVLDIYNHEKDDKGYFFNYLLSPIIDLIDLSRRIVLQNTTKYVKKLKHRPNIETSNFSLLIGIINRVYKKIGLYDSQISELSNLINLYFKKTGAKIKVDNDSVRSILYYFLAERFVYKYLYILLQNEYLFLVDAVGSGRVAAAIELNIKVIEFQHGIIDKYKPDYIYSHKYKSRKYLFPIPKTIITFGDYHSSAILRTGFFDAAEVRSVGNFKIQKIRKYIESLEVNKHEHFVILLPTQWHVFNETKKLLYNLIQLSKDSNIKILIKPHPREVQNHIVWFEKVSKEHDFISLEKNKNIYDCLKFASICVGFDSTVLLESVALEIPTISISTDEMPTGIHEYLIDTSLKKSIVVTPVSNIKHLINSYMVDHKKRSAWKENCKSVSSFLYSKDYEENIGQFISYLNEEK